MSGNRSASASLRAVGATIVSLVIALVDTIRRVLAEGLRYAEHWLVVQKHARYGLAVTRILIAGAGLGLLATNFHTRLYTFGSGSAWNGEAEAPRSDFPDIPLFSLFNSLALDDAMFTLAYILLALFAIAVLVGWRTRLMLPLYFVGWVSFIEMNDFVGDQGDNMYRITLLSLLFADSAARWSVDAGRRCRVSATRGTWLLQVWQGRRVLPEWLTNAAHNLVLVTLTAQVSFIYVSGALYKAGGDAWQSGSAIYDPLQTQRFGAWPELSELVTTWAPLGAALAWGSIILQLSFPFMLMRRPTRIVALFGILGFHIGIAVMMGLPWFSLAMIAVDAIFIRDATWRGLQEKVAAGWRQANVREPGDPDRDDGSRVGGASGATDLTDAVVLLSGPNGQSSRRDRR